jgi:pyridoxine kinase
MGAQPCPLPTAILSAQTGYPSFYCDDYTEKMEYFRCEWEKMGVAFDGIYTGYVANEEQVAQIFRFLDTFQVGNSLNRGKASERLSGQENLTDCLPEGRSLENHRPYLLVDPVMGDDGRTYKMFTPKLLEQMKRLTARADIITPNLTELCLLTGNDFQELKCLSESGKGGSRRELSVRNDMFLEAVGRMAREMIAKGPRIVVVTGIGFEDPANGVARIGNLATVKMGPRPEDGGGFPERNVNGLSDGTIVSRLSTFPYVGGSFSGTGDLFASVLAGGMARGDGVFETVELAGKFIARAMEDAAREGVERNEGANFEKYLGMLNTWKS